MTTFKWKRLPSGRMRFFGDDAMREIRGLVAGDSSFSWSYPAWPYYWIDVLPLTVEARDLLLEIVGDQHE